MGLFDKFLKKNKNKAVIKTAKKDENVDTMTTGKNVAVKSRTRAEKAADALEAAMRAAE